MSPIRKPLTAEQRERAYQHNRERYANDAQYRERRNLAGREHRKSPEQKTLARRRYASNREFYKQRARQHYYANRDAKLEHTRWQTLERLYGVTLDMYHALVEKQGERCACCRDIPKRLVVDHDHQTGKVRGLLCDNCNVMLGLAKDQSPRLRAAIRYLETHAESPSGC